MIRIIPRSDYTGLHSGEVVVRTIGNDLTMDYDAIGQTTHLASRMEQLALPGSIRMTADTLRLAEGLVQVRPLGPIPVKGLAQPIEVFELIGAAAVRSRFGISHAYLRQGRIADAIHILERGYEQTKLSNIEAAFDQVVSRLAYAYAQAGRSEEARALSQI